MQVQAWCQIDLRTYLMHRLYTNLTVLLFGLHTYGNSNAIHEQAAVDQENSTAAGSEKKVRQKSRRAARRNKSKLKKGFSDALDSEDSAVAGINLKVRKKTQKAARRNKSKPRENVSAALDSEDSTAVNSESTVRQTTQENAPRDKIKLEDSASATEAASLCYTALGKDEFRLLYIAPGEKDDPLVCRLEHTSFQTIEYYCALSYTWGSPETPFSINCNGSDIRITRSLHEALCQMRRTWRPVVIWADAICINQTDNLEKAQQVMRMGEIYSKAGRLFIWLGNPVTASDADVAVATVEKLGQIAESLKLKFKDVSSNRTFFDIIWQDRMRAESISENKWQSLQDFFLAPWFSRVWIFQEVASVMAFSPENIRVGYGNRVVGWKAVFSIMGIPELFKTVDLVSVRWPTAVTMERELFLESMTRKVNFQLPADEITEEDVAEALDRKYPPGFRPLGAHERQGRLTANVAVVIDLCKLNFPISDRMDFSTIDKVLMTEAVLTISSHMQGTYPSITEILHCCYFQTRLMYLTFITRGPPILESRLLPRRLPFHILFQVTVHHVCDKYTR